MTKNYSKMIQDEIDNIRWTNTEDVLKLVLKTLCFCADELSGVREELHYLNGTMWACAARDE